MKRRKECPPCPCKCPKPKPIAEFPNLPEMHMPTMEEALETTRGKERYRKERAAEQRRKEKQEEKMLK